MIDNKWFCEPNEQRESWCFLFLKVNHFVIDGWEVGYGNPTMLVRKVANRKSRERELIKELLQELYHCRRENIMLITYAYSALPTLRTRIILLNLKDACLHGIKYISIEKLLEEYFLLLNSTNISELVRKMNIEMEGSSQAKLLWNLFMRIGPMLPAGVI